METTLLQLVNYIAQIAIFHFSTVSWVPSSKQEALRSAAPCRGKRWFRDSWGVTKKIARVHGWMPAYDQTYHWYTSSWQKRVALNSRVGEFQEWEGGEPWVIWKRLLWADSVDIFRPKRSRGKGTAFLQSKVLIFFFEPFELDLALFISDFDIHLWWTKIPFKNRTFSFIIITAENMMSPKSRLKLPKAGRSTAKTRPEKFGSDVLGAIYRGMFLQGSLWTFMISAVFLAGPKVYIYVDYYFGNLQIDYVCRASIQHILQQQNIEINPREFKRHESFWVDVYKSTCELKSKVTASYIKCIFERNFPSAQAQLWICRKGYKVHHLFLGGCRLPFCSQVTLVVCGCWMQNEIARDCLALSLSLSVRQWSWHKRWTFSQPYLANHW